MESIQQSTESLRDLVVWQDPKRMSGTPCFAKTRVPITTLFDYLEVGDSLNEFLEHFPGVTREQAVGALRLGKDQSINGLASPISSTRRPKYTLDELVAQVT